jgi:hypothetical protein
MFLTIDDRTLAAVTGGALASPATMMLAIMLGMQMRGIPRDRKQKLFEVVKGLVESKMKGGK